jgi:hypothetical protein
MPVTIGDFDEFAEHLNAGGRGTAYTLRGDGTGDVNVTGRKIIVDSPGGLGKRKRDDWTGFSLVTTDRAQNLISQISRAQAVSFCRYFNHNYSFPGNHRDVKTALKWREVCGVFQYQFAKINKAAQTGTREMVDATYCRGACGYILPLRTLTIDHQRPQSTGRYDAVARVFRGFGLTVDGPRGFKNNDALQMIAANVGGTLHAAPPATKTPAQKQLNNVGVIYYSILRHNTLNVLLQNCMDHYLNLAPMCGPCNSSRNNRH